MAGLKSLACAVDGKICVIRLTQDGEYRDAVGPLAIRRRDGQKSDVAGEKMYSVIALAHMSVEGISGDL